jgi:Sulfotransferase domain
MQQKDATFITIVSGLPRSGTSLMMQMLRAGGMPVLTDHKRAPDEDNPKGYWELEAVKHTRASSSWLTQAQGKAVKLVHLLLLDLPTEGYSYRVLLMKRRMAEVLASQRVMLRRQGKSGAALSDERLAEVFAGQMNRIESWLKGQPRFAVLSVDYNALIADSAPQAAAISHFLDGSLDTAKMIQAVSPELYHQRLA